MEGLAAGGGALVFTFAFADDLVAFFLAVG